MYAPVILFARCDRECLGRRRRLRIAATWPWADAIAAAWAAITALLQAP
jgi:hypothetical protein